jgi:hypothetical protein
LSLAINRLKEEIREADTNFQVIVDLSYELQKMKSNFFEIFETEGYHKAYEGITEKHLERLNLRRAKDFEEIRELKANRRRKKLD